MTYSISKQKVFDFLKAESIVEEITSGDIFEIFENLQAIWNHASFVWARYCNRAVDRKNRNQHKATTSELWHKIHLAEFSAPQKTAKRIPQLTIKNIAALKDQFRGLGMSLAASEGFITDQDQIVRIGQRIFQEEINRFYEEDESEFLRRMQTRFDECYSTVL